MNYRDCLTIRPTLVERIYIVHIRSVEPVRQNLAWQQESYASANQNDILKRSAAKWSYAIRCYPTPLLPPNILAKTTNI